MLLIKNANLISMEAINYEIKDKGQNINYWYIICIIYNNDNQFIKRNLMRFLFFDKYSKIII